VSYVNLKTGAVEKVFQVVTDVYQVVLAANGYMYLFPQREWSDIYSLEIASGAVTATGAIYNGRVPRLSADGKYLYVGGSSYSKWDIRQGTAKLLNSSFGINTCGNLWLTEDGRRAFTACGKAYITSEIPAEDVQYNGTLSGTSNIRWADQSAQQQMTAVLPLEQSYSYSVPQEKPAGDTQVRLYDDDYLGFKGAVPLPHFTAGGNTYAGHGRFVFWNKDASALYVLMQADSTAQLLSNWGLARISPSSALQLSVSEINNAASQLPGRLAPGEIVTIKGLGLGPASDASFSLDPITKKVGTSLAGTQVFFNGIAAPVLYTSAQQVNAIVPYDLGYQGTVKVQVAYQGIPSPSIDLSIATAIPAVFTLTGSGTGQAIAINLDGTLADSSHPAARGAYVTVYFTGGGTTNPSGVNGSVSGTTLKRLSQTALATVGGQPATVTFAGAAPGFVEGVGQLNLRLADNTPTGPAQEIILTVGTNSSPASATIAVK
jgi:uncharacterized protein (TIGR03437 family)